MSLLPVRSEIKHIRPYVPGKPISQVQRELGLEQVTKLDSNENPFGPSPAAAQAIAAAAMQAHRYPEAAAFDLRQALKRHTGLEADWIFASNGSDEFFSLLATVYLAPDRHVVVADPTFSQYASSAMLMGAKVHKVACRDDGAMDLPAMLATAQAVGASIVYLCRPNNPTGGVFPTEALTEFLDQLPQSVFVVLDEAYVEYDSTRFDSIGLLRQYRNLIVTRTFSKAYGLAGVRLGYGLAHPEVLEPLRTVREPFSVNLLAQLAGPAALGDIAFLEETIRVNEAERQRLTSAFGQLGWRVLPSEANFVLSDTGADAGALCTALLQRGVIIRSGIPFGLPHSVRISVGTPEQNSVLLALLQTPDVQSLWQREAIAPASD